MMAADRRVRGAWVGLAWLALMPMAAQAKTHAKNPPHHHGHRAAQKDAQNANTKADSDPGNANVVPTFSGRTEVVWLGHAAWQLRSPGGALVMIDPWLDNPQAPAKVELPEALDAIVVTHGHFDHVGNAAALARRTGAKVIGSFELVELLGLPDPQKVPANPGGAIVVRDVTLSLVEAVHSSSLTRGDTTHYAGAAMGVVVSIEHGPTFYHAGDTDVFASMSLIARRFAPKIGMLPIGGHFTMGPKDAALAAQLLGLTTVLPMHYGTFPVLTGTPEALARALPAKIKMQVPKPGQVMTF